MRVPIKVDYGVRALVDLALHSDGKPVRTAEIASRQHIPESYLDQVLTVLNKFSFIRSRRGPHGGHLLAKPPAEINLNMIVNSLEGNHPPLDCLDDPGACVLSDNCGQQGVWRGVEEAVRAVLSTTTVADLANQQRDEAGRRREAVFAARSGA